MVSFNQKILRFEILTKVFSSILDQTIDALFGLLAILVDMCGWNFKIKQTMLIKRALSRESSYEVSIKLDEKLSRVIFHSSQIVFFQFVHYTCYSGAVCPLQVLGITALNSDELIINTIVF